MTKKKFGLSMLNPRARLALVVATGTLFILINSIPVAAALLVLGFILFLFEEKQSWKLALSVPFTGGMMFFYNLIFSPGQIGSHWWIFTINIVGFTRGLVMSLRLMGVMFTSLAWIASTSYIEMYEAVEWFAPGREWLLGSMRGVQVLEREFVALTQSLIVRGLKWNSVIANIKNLVPLGTAIIPRVLENSQKATLAFVSHKGVKPSGNGKISVKEVFVRYDSASEPVLKDINLDISSGQFVFLAGKNKSGKTTLLRTIGGVIPRIMGEFKGSIEVSGMHTHIDGLSDISASARYIAPDPFASIHGLNVGQEIRFLAGSEEESRKALKVMGIEELWQKETTRLSGGQQVRLVLAGALASNAKILLLDSPLQELDPQGREDFREALSILRKNKGTTILAADQFWKDFVPQSDSVTVLENGELSANVTPAQFSANGWIKRCNLDEPAFNRVKNPSGAVIASMKGVEVNLDGTKILKGFDFDAREGELIAIVGPNGSGKTTAMLTLAGAIKPSKGVIEVRGRVGYIFQNAALQLLAMTAEEEVAFGPKILKWRGEEVTKFVGSALDWAGLEASVCPLDLHPQEIRSLVIAACNTNVDTLVLDEPTVGLDSQAVAKVLDLINSLTGQGKSVVVITHDTNLAACADRVLRIEDGKIVSEGET